MIASEKGLQFVAAREAMSLTAYRDTSLLAVGFGQNDPALKPDDTITEEQATELLIAFATGLEKSLGIIFDGMPLLQHQFDALFSVAYNIGPTWLRKGNAHLIDAVRAHSAAQHDRQLREEVGQAFALVTGPPVTKGGVPRSPFNLSRRCREALVYVSADYGDLTTLKMWPAGKSPRDNPVTPPTVVPMPRFIRR